MPADLRVVKDYDADLEAALEHCRRTISGLYAKLLELEGASAPGYAYELARKAEHMAITLESAFSVLAVLIEKKEEE